MPYINGRTEEMEAYAPQGPGLIGPQEHLVTLLDERGESFCDNDGAVTDKLTTFIAAANEGFGVLARISQDSGRDYFTGDAGGAAALRVYDANRQW
jgi:hypothetical protein